MRADPCHFQGFYFGENIGVGINKSDFSSDFFLGLAEIEIPVNLVFADHAPATPPPVIYEVMTDAEMTGKLRMVEYTVDAKIGWLLSCQTLAYALFGVAFNRTSFHVDSTVSALRIADLDLDHLGVDLHLNRARQRISFRWGLGLEHMLAYWLSGHVQYTYTNYGSAAVKENEVQVIPRLSSILESMFEGSTSLSRQTLSAGLSYHF